MDRLYCCSLQTVPWTPSGAAILVVESERGKNGQALWSQPGFVKGRGKVREGRGKQSWGHVRTLYEGTEDADTAPGG
jgi:hypothetical protein